MGLTFDWRGRIIYWHAKPNYRRGAQAPASKFHQGQRSMTLT